MEEEGGSRQEKLFPASAHLYFLLIASCSGKIILEHAKQQEPQR